MSIIESVLRILQSFGMMTSSLLNTTVRLTLNTEDIALHIDKVRHIPPIIIINHYQQVQTSNYNGQTFTAFTSSKLHNIIIYTIPLYTNR